MITEAIILAGGLGTRLKTAVPDLPKCLAPVVGKPFLEHLIRHGQKAGIRRFIFALGYKSDLVESFVRSVLPASAFVFSVEQEPLGTGGAIRLACGQVNAADVLVMNGDTFFAVNLEQFSAFHRERKAACSLALKPMRQFDRYGAVEKDERQVITGFSEKKYMASGFINGGVYALNKDELLTNAFPGVFSFEKGYLEKTCGRGRLFGMLSDAYFIDIGIPEDYLRAQTELIQHLSDGI